MWPGRKNEISSMMIFMEPIFSSDHQVVALASGIAIIEMNGTQGAKSLEYAGNNEATIIWSDTRSGSGNDIYCQKLNMDMDKIFADDGLAVAATADLETTPRTTYMTNDTSFIIWQSGTENTDIFYNLLTSNGLVFTDAVQLCNFDSPKVSPRVKRNSLGDIFSSGSIIDQIPRKAIISFSGLQIAVDSLG
ncbi:MAG: hypothetical protein CM1200mP10_14640 [Candidatus Neomarinimicrobiota bacterium]|nr:MAG: hypothetical protein CM1200mP10_14640 [Candidatus Neomarinimicrobiota bacterium]